MNEWIRNPFVNFPNHLSVQEEDQMIKIANDGGLKSVFQQTSLAGFWIKTKAECPEISVKALKTLLPFPTTYLCEAGFSAMTATKTKLRNRLDISNTLRVSLSSITPRWNLLVAGKQAQGSHWLKWIVAYSVASQTRVKFPYWHFVLCMFTLDRCYFKFSSIYLCS